MTEQQLKNLSWPRVWYTPLGPLAYYTDPESQRYLIEHNLVTKRTKSPADVLRSNHALVQLWAEAICDPRAMNTKRLLHCAEVVSRCEGLSLPTPPRQCPRTKAEIKAALLERTRLAGPRRKFFLNKKLK